MTEDEMRKIIEEHKERWEVENGRRWKICQIYNGGGVNFQFLSYCWAFYGPEGVYPIKGLTLQQMADACAFVQSLEPNWCGGDTDDRLSACKVLLSKNPELSNPYGDEE